MHYTVSLRHLTHSEVDHLYDGKWRVARGGNDTCMYLERTCYCGRMFIYQGVTGWGGVLSVYIIRYVGETSPVECLLTMHMECLDLVAYPNLYMRRTQLIHPRLI